MQYQLLQKKEILFYSDELNHASIIEACKLSDAKIVIYKHNDIADLEKKLKQKSKNKFVVTEGIFSMDGDFSSLKQITEISEKQMQLQLLMMHMVILLLEKMVKELQVILMFQRKIDLYISSLSKGLGSFGGILQQKITSLIYVLTNQNHLSIHQHFHHSCRTFSKKNSIK